MSVLVDTSALYAALDSADPNHAAADAAFRSLGPGDVVTHSYVIVESSALVQRRLGGAALHDLLEVLLRPFRVVWVEEDVHRAAAAGLLAAPASGVSLVDRVSFEVMRREGIRRAFAFDRDFHDAGFETIP